MGALCSNGEVPFEMKEGVAGQDDIACIIFFKHLQLAPSDLDKFYRIFSKLEHEGEAHYHQQNQQREGEGEDEGEVEPAVPVGEIHKGSCFTFFLFRLFVMYVCAMSLLIHHLHACMMYVLISMSYDSDAVFQYLSIPKTIVNQRLFSFFPDKHFTGMITFLPFVASLWHFLSFNVKW
jgi:hypothetical protein